MLRPPAAEQSTLTHRKYECFIIAPRFTLRATRCQPFRTGAKAIRYIETYYEKPETNRGGNRRKLTCGAAHSRCCGAFHFRQRTELPEKPESAEDRRAEGMARRVPGAEPKACDIVRVTVGNAAAADGLPGEPSDERSYTYCS